MKRLYLPLPLFFCLFLPKFLNAQCPPAGFPNPGYTCVTAPLLCPDLDGYCINTGIAPPVVPPVPIVGCGGNMWVWNNPIWFAFFAGTSTITMNFTASNCTNGNGMQAGIYDNCINTPMALKCNCNMSANNFTLTSSSFVPGEIYYIFIDGCNGADCDLAIDVTAGSTMQQPPGVPGAITGLDTVCVGQTNAYSITPTAFTTAYEWTVSPVGGGTPSNMNANTNMTWSSNPGTYEVCVMPVNQCLDGQQSCKDVVVIPQPTAVLSGSGVLCGGNGPVDPVELTVTFTGAAPWRFVYSIGGVNQPAIVTDDNPYTLNISSPGNVVLVSVETNIPGPNCPGTVSGTVLITQINMTPTAATTPSTCSQENGNINLSVGGNGAPPLTFNWSNGETTEDLTGVVGGQVYTVTVTDNNGCTRTLTVPLTNNNPPINITGITSPNTTCDPAGNGSINITATPANTNYEYEWSNGETTEDLTNVPPGTYTVTVTLGTTCSGSASFTVANTPNNPNVSITGTPAICGLPNGNVNITVSGGVPPYTFEWSNGETTEDLTGVVGGQTYTVTVTGANGCTETASIALPNQQPQISINGTVVQNTTCPPANPNGSITIQISPPNPPTGGSWQIEWSNGVTTLSNPNLEPGSYSVTVDGGGDCTQTATFTVGNNVVLPNVTATTVNAICETATGSINASVSGGVPPYTYEWSNGETTQDLSNLEPGDYTLTVTGANGCTKTLQVTVGNTNPPITINGTVVQNTTCPPADPNGSITITISPANPPGGGTWDIEWSNGVTTLNNPNLEPGTYTVTATGNGDCTQTASFTVNNNPNNPNVTATTTNAICETATGSINVTVTGGVSPYTYDWSNGATTQDQSNIEPGDYTVTVTGANGCTRTLQVTVGNINPPITINGTVVQNTTCPPADPNGSITISINPPTPPGGGTYQIEWSNGVTTLNNPNLEPGSYTVTVSGNGDCSQTATFNINNNPNLPNVTATTTPALCELANGSINVSVSGGVPPYTYEWSNGATTQDQSNVEPGDYTVTVTGANGCTKTLEVTVSNNNPPININANIQPNTTCPPANGNGSITISISPATPPTGGTWQIEWSTGQTTLSITGQQGGSYSVTVTGAGACTQEAEFEIPDQPNEPELDATTNPGVCGLSTGDINLSVSGGVPPYTYNWSSGQTTQDLNNVPAGSYSVTVTAANGCTAELQIDLENENPDINIDADITENSSCTGGNGSIVLTISPQPSPTGQPYIILWSTGQTTTSITGLSSGTYSVTVNGGGDCTAEATFDVPNDPNLPNLDYDTEPSFCDLANGDIDISPSGGQPPYTYLWSSGQTTQDLHNILPGSYTVTMTDANGCTTEITVDLENENPEIDLDADIENNTACVGGNGYIHLQISPQPSPTGQPYIIQWSTGATGLNLNNLPAGSYSVTVNGGGSCTNEATFDVPNDDQAPEPEADVEPAICGASNGSINISISGGEPPYTYSWGSGQTTQDLNNIPAGVYSLTVTDKIGCEGFLDVDVPDEQIDIFLNEDIEANTACKAPFNGSIFIEIDPDDQPMFVIWSNGSTKTNLTNLAPGDYTVTVSTAANGGGCTTEVTFTVDDQSIIPTMDYIIEPAFCGVKNGSVDVEVLDGNEPFTFKWSNGSFFEDLENLAAGTYTLTVTGLVACSATLEIEIPDEILAFNANGIVGNVTSCQSPNGEISLEMDPEESDLPDNMFYTFNWSNGEKDQEIYDLEPGDYTVTVSTGVFGCTQEFAFNVADDAVPPTANTAATAATCGLPNGSVNLTVAGANPPFTFNWSNGAKTEDLPTVAPGTYIVTVTDFFDCQTTATAVVGNNNLAINLTPTTSPNTSCSAVNGSIALAVAPAGTYTFAWSNAQNSQNINNLSAGNYTVTVSAGGTCTATTTVAVADQITEPQISEVVTPTICGDSNGAIDVSAAPATNAPFIFNWSNSSNSEDLSGLTAGNFTVTVTDASGCTASKVINVPNNSSNFAVSGTSKNVVRCDSPDGAVDLTVLPTGAAYIFAWSNSATTEDLQNLPAGTYTVTVNVAGNVSCPATASFTILDERVLPLLSQNIQPALCGLPNGTFDLTPSGGTPIYNYVWSNAATTEDLQNVLAGNYTVTMTDANGCTAAAAGTIPDNSVNFSVSGTTAANTSCDTNTGGIQLDISPASTPLGGYTFSWSNSAATQNLTGLPGGLFDVTVSAGGTCTAVANFQVPTTTLDPMISRTFDPALCGEPTGSIDLSISGGVSPFIFQWASSNGTPLPTTEDLQGIAAGQYTVTVTGANGCTSTTGVNIANNSANFSLTANVLANTLCVGSDGSIDLSISPSNTYKIEWSNAATTEDLQNLPAGQYQVTVTQGVDCTKTATFNVSDDSNAPTLAATKTDATCGEPTGNINLSISGGTAPYQIIWSNSQTTEDIANLLPNDYSATVTGADGCQSVRNVKIDDQLVNILANGTPDANTACTNFNGSIDLQVSPTNPLYVYNWSNFAQTEDLQNLQGGQYSVTITLGKTCFGFETVDVQDDLNLPLIVENIKPDICYGSVGSINLSVVGVSPFKYVWAHGPTNEDLLNLPVGDYAVTVTAANGCTATGSYKVGNTSNTFSFTGLATANTVCGTPNGAVKLTITPANGTYTFDWSNGEKTKDISNLPPGDYTVTIFDGGTCTAEQTYTVEDKAPSPKITGTPVDIRCFGDLTGSIQLTVTGGLAPLNYGWTPAVANPTAPQNLPAGNYSLVLTDAANCTATADFEIKQPTSALALACQPIKITSMPGVPDGAGRVNIAGGTAPYFVDWSPGGQQAGVAPGAFDINNLADGFYDVTVTDAKGCTAVCQFEISAFICITRVGSMSLAAAKICGTGCFTAIYDASKEVLDADDAIQFVLHEGSGKAIVNEILRNTTPEFCFEKTKMAFGKTYYISAVAGNSVNGTVDLKDICTLVAAGTPITFYEIPIAAIAPHGVINCQNKNLSLVGSSSVAGAIFIWSTSGGGQISGATNQPTATATSDGNFQLIIDNNGCRDTAQTAVASTANTIQAFITSDPAFILDCVVKAVNLTAEGVGSNDIGFIWTLNGTLISTNGSISVEASGIFQLVAQDTITFCADTAKVEILDGEKYPPLTVNPAKPLTCRDTTIQLSGGSPVQGLDYHWIKIVAVGDTVVVGTGNPIFVDEPGNYFFVGTDPKNGCTNALPVSVLQDLAKPKANAGADFTLSCIDPVQYLNGGGSTGAGGLQYSWTTANGNLVSGQTTSKPGVDAPGIYQLVVANLGNGCTDSDEMEVNSTGPFLEPVVVHPKCFGEKGRLDLSDATGGTPPYRFSIDGGQKFTTQQVYPSVAAGVYLLVVQDALGCEANETATIIEPEKLVVEISTDATTIVLGESYQISTQINVAPDSLASILWTPATSLSCSDCLDPLATPLFTTVYKIEISDSVGCRAADELKVRVVRGNVYVPNVFNPTGGDGNTTASIFADTRSVVKIRSFKIFDRWGEHVFERYEFPPNDPSLGWDGRFLGDYMNPAVFVWYAEVEFFDGVVEFFEGDVSLVRD